MERLHFQATLGILDAHSFEHRTHPLFQNGWFDQTEVLLFLLTDRKLMISIGCQDRDQRQLAGPNPGLHLGKVQGRGKGQLGRFAPQGECAEELFLGKRSFEKIQVESRLKFEFIRVRIRLDREFT